MSSPARAEGLGMLMHICLVDLYVIIYGKAYQIASNLYNNVKKHAKNLCSFQYPDIFFFFLISCWFGNVMRPFFFFFRLQTNNKSFCYVVIFIYWFYFYLILRDIGRVIFLMSHVYLERAVLLASLLDFFFIGHRQFGKITSLFQNPSIAEMQIFLLIFDNGFGDKTCLETFFVCFRVLCFQWNINVHGLSNANDILV